MPSYSTPEAVAGFLKDFQMRINHQEKGTFSPAHVRYFLTISRYGKECSPPSYNGAATSRKHVPCHARTAGSSPPSQTMPSPCENTPLTSLWTSSTHRGEWLEEADAQGLLEGCKGDIYRMIQMAQYECFSQDLYDHREDICKNVTLSQLTSEGIYAIRTDVADDLLGDLDYDGDSVQTDEAKDAITGAIYATFEEKYGEDFAECATDFVRDNDDITGRVNPCALSAETVRAVNESGYDAVFAEQWKDELSECDIDPDAVSIESEAHDMANGKDELSGDTPAKDAPAKEGHEEPPSGTDDNR